MGIKLLCNGKAGFNFFQGFIVVTFFDIDNPATKFNFSGAEAILGNVMEYVSRVIIGARFGEITLSQNRWWLVLNGSWALIH